MRYGLTAHSKAAAAEGNAVHCLDFERNDLNLHPPGGVDSGCQAVLKTVAR